MRRRRKTAVVAGKARMVAPTVLSAVIAETVSLNAMGSHLSSQVAVPYPGQMLLSLRLRKQRRGESGVGFTCWQILGDDDQAVRVDHRQLLAAELDDAALLPGGERARDRVEGGAGHLGDVLARHREIDEDAAFDAAPGLRHEAGDGVGDAPLDPLGLHLA